MRRAPADALSVPALPKDAVSTLNFPTYQTMRLAEIVNPVPAPPEAAEDERIEDMAWIVAAAPPTEEEAP